MKIVHITKHTRLKAKYHKDVHFVADNPEAALLFSGEPVFENVKFSGAFKSITAANTESYDGVDLTECICKKVYFALSKGYAGITSLAHNLDRVADFYIGYKKLGGGQIIKLLIPVGAKIVNPWNGNNQHKLRTSSAIVHSVVYKEPGNESAPLRSWWNFSFEYKVGEIVQALYFDELGCRVCREGIHFFATFEEAKNYNFN